MNRALLALPSLLAVSCATAPTTPLPEPLPETLEWAAADAGSGGAFLGLKTRENDSGSLDELFFEPGVRVTRVVEGSPAAEAGFQVGDVVLRFAGEAVDDPGALDAVVEASRPGERVALGVRRGDSEFDVPVVLAGTRGEVEAPVLVARIDPVRSQASWLTGRGGVVLVSSRDDGPFPDAGVPVGSVVRAVDGEPVRSDRALIRLLEAKGPGAEVEIDFEGADGEPRTAEVDLYDAPRRVTRFGVPILVDYEAEADGTKVHFDLLDLWILSLFAYDRDGGERRWSLLSLIRFATGEGELTE